MNGVEWPDLRNEETVAQQPLQTTLTAQRRFARKLALLRCAALCSWLYNPRTTDDTCLPKHPSIFLLTALDASIPLIYNFHHEILDPPRTVRPRPSSPIPSTWRRRDQHRRENGRVSMTV